MPKTIGSGVAIVPRLDTGIIRSSEGEQDLSVCEVLCDRAERLFKCENVVLVSEEMGAGHGRFDGAELESDLKEFFKKRFPHLHILVKYWEEEKVAGKKKREANFKFLLKPNESNKIGDPFYVHVINGNAITRFVDAKSISNI